MIAALVDVESTLWMWMCMIDAVVDVVYKALNRENQLECIRQLIRVYSTRVRLDHRLRALVVDVDVDEADG